MTQTDQLPKLLGVEVLSNRFMSEKEWFNTRLNKWIKPKYVLRTKYKELKPYVIIFDGKAFTHPTNLPKL